MKLTSTYRALIAIISVIREKTSIVSKDRVRFGIARALRMGPGANNDCVWIEYQYHGCNN